MGVGKKHSENSCFYSGCLLWKRGRENLCIGGYSLRIWICFSLWQFHFSVPESKLPSDEIYNLPCRKNKAKQSKWSPVAFPFCLSLSGGICAGAALLHPAPGCAAQHHLAWVSFPVSQELRGADFLGSGSRVHDVGCQSIASTSLCGALQG